MRMRVIHLLSYGPVDLAHLLCAGDDGDDGACDVPRGGSEGMSQCKDSLVVQLGSLYLCYDACDRNADDDVLSAYLQ